jgi:hypothetical protein
LRLGDAVKRQQRNCDCKSNPSFALEWAPDVRRCPKSILTEEIWQVVRWWMEWKEYQTLPFSGGMGDQPAYVCEAITICVDEAAKVMSELEKRPKPKG